MLPFLLSQAAHVGRGVLMGMAGLFPSVSAGTIALILGVHARLVSAVASIDLRFPGTMWRASRGDSDARRDLIEHDLGFLGLLALGMGIAVFAGVNGVDWLLVNQPRGLMALFVGLMAAGSLLVWRRVESPEWQHGLWFLMGLLAATILVLLPPLLTIGGGIGYFLAGFIAWSFMLLPGVSGSSMMVVLGIYEPLIAAAKNLQWGALFAFALGGLGGLALCSRLLQWLLLHKPKATYGALAGMIAGSVLRVWPWRSEPGFANGVPTAVEWSAGDGWLILAFLGGVLIVRVLERLGPKPAVVSSGAAAPDANP